MTTYKQIITEINTILKELYPKIRRYGNQTVDKAEPPYFFVECVPAGIQRETKNMMHKGCTIKITYVQRTQNDADALDKAEEICEKLGMVFHVNGRKLLVLDYGHDHIGENNDIMQISFRLDWYEDTETEPTEDIIKDASIRTEQKGGF